MRSFYQDRLGTNIGETQKRLPFSGELGHSHISVLKIDTEGGEFEDVMGNNAERNNHRLVVSASFLHHFLMTIDRLPRQARDTQQSLKAKRHFALCEGLHLEGVLAAVDSFCAEFHYYSTLDHEGSTVW
jgi:hypothetical protein